METLKPKTWRIKNGRPIHDGDCYFFGKKICTCGLIHHLMPVQFDSATEDDPEGWFIRESVMHETQLEKTPDYVHPPIRSEKEEQFLKDEAFRLFGVKL